jgi:hypothetical protein
MDSATDTNTGKRVRFNTDPTCPTKLSPLDRALFCANVTLASLPLTMKPLAQSHFDKFIKLRLEYDRLVSTKARLSREDYIPHSLRLNFELNASNRIKGNKDLNPEYIKMKETCAMRLDIYQSMVTDTMIELVDLELKTLTTVLATLYCKSISQILIGLILSKGPVCANWKEPILYKLICMTIDNKPDLLKHSGLEHTEFYEYFKIAAGSSMEVHVPNAEIHSAPEDLVILQPHAEQFQGILDALFTKSWDEFLLGKIERETELNVKEFVDKQLIEIETEDTLIDLSNEIIVDANIEALIARKVAAGIKPILAELNQLKKTTAKNVPGGAKATGPLPKNKTPATKQGKGKKGNENPKGSGKPAAAAGKDSKNANKDNKKKNGPNKRKNGKETTTKRTAQ